MGKENFMPTLLPSTWPMTRLKYVASVRYGKALASDNREHTGKVPVFGSSTTTGFHDVAFHHKPSIVIGRKGSVGSVQYVEVPFWPIDTVFFLDDVSPSVNLRFLAAALSYFGLERYKIVVGVPGINRSDLENFQFPLPPLSEQQRIVEVLQEAEEIRHLRTKAEAKTAELIPAIYHQMFFRAGNRNAWGNTSIAEIAADNENAIRTGPFGSDLLHSEFVDSGTPVLGIDNVVSNRFRWAERRYISSGKYSDLERFRVYPDDVMITIMGTVGRVAVAPQDLPEAISTKHLCVITPNQDKILPTFLWATLLYDPSVRSQTKSAGKGAIMEGWNSKIIRALKFPLPPLKLQRQFEILVNEVLELEESLLSTPLGLALNSSLSAHAFSGQLTADWREANKDRLAIEARERDAALKEAGATFSRSRRTMAEDIAELLQDRADGIYADLNREQRFLLREIERLFAGVDSGRYFTAEQLAADIKGSLHRHPQRIESHLALFAARGLIIPVSRPRTDNTGPAFAACYRLPVVGMQFTEDGKDANTFDGDDIRATLMETQRRLATGRM